MQFLEVVMRETLVVSERGQLTLPVRLRKRFGIEKGGPVIVEEREREIVLKPALVMEADIYTDEQVVEWVKEDMLSASERKTIVKKAQRKQ
jgi:AbrB family looped-hinge helix DNA binding protein